MALLALIQSQSLLFTLKKDLMKALGFSSGISIIFKGILEEDFCDVRWYAVVRELKRFRD